MTTTLAPAPARLSDERLATLLSLLRQSDSVELKLTVPEVAHRATIDAFGIDPLDAQIRQVFFLETPDLRLNAAGLVVRARRIQGRRGDSVVKLRPVVPSELPDALRQSPDFGIEIDAMPGGFVCSGSLKSPVANGPIRDAVAGLLPKRKLFTKEQRGLLQTRAPDDIALDDLVFLGPVFVLKAKWTPAELQPMTAEMWLYPDGSRILELSTKCTPLDAFRVAAESRAYLSAHGISLSGQQETKTKKALDFFARRLAAEDAHQ
jgi:hypothetical protein